MKASAIYLKAAKQVHSDWHLHKRDAESCIAISKAALGNGDYYKINHPLRIAYAQTFGFSHRAFAPALQKMHKVYRQEMRVLMLLLMSEIAKDSE